MGLFSIPESHMRNWGDALATPTSEDKPWSDTPEYHQWAAQDLTQEKSKEIADQYGNFAAGAFELGAPFVALGASPFYDIPQAISRYYENPDNYTGIWNAIDQENPISAAYNRMIGASQPIYNRMKMGWGNIKDKFSNSAQAAAPDDITRAMQTDHMRRRTNFPTTVPAHMRRQTFDNVNFNEWMRNDINLAQRKSTAQKFANLDNFTRSPHTGFKKSGADLDKWGNRRMALENPAKDPYEKPSGLMQLKDWAIDKLGTGVNWGQMAISGIGNAIMPGLGFVLSALNPGKLRGYNYNQGRYNTQAEYEANRAARQYQKRLGNLLSRKASGKGYSQKNLNEITMGSRPGFYGNQATVSAINRAKHNIGMPEHLGDRGSIKAPRSINKNSPAHPSNRNPGSGGGIGSAAAARGPAGESIGASRGLARGGRMNRGGLASLWPR